MRVGSMGYRIQTAFDQLVREGLRIRNDVLDIGLELRFQSFAKSNGFSGNYMHQRTPLNTGEDCRIKFLGERGIIGHDHTAAGTAKGLMRGGCGDMGMWEGAWVFTRCDQSREMCHIDM